MTPQAHDVNWLDPVIRKNVREMRRFSREIRRHRRWRWLRERLHHRTSLSGAQPPAESSTLVSLARPDSAQPTAPTNEEVL